MSAIKELETLHWVGGVDGHLMLIDQTLLPTEFLEIECHDVAELWEAIRVLRVRGAPAIGIAAAYGVCLGVRTAVQDGEEGIYSRLKEVTDYLASSRPTAVNLFWALDRMNRCAASLRGSNNPPAKVLDALLKEAMAIHDEDRQTCRAIGRYGAELLGERRGLLTHCNAGGLATSAFGTALSVMFTCHEQGKTLRVFVDETRPLLQGARLTAWELVQRGINATLICDGMAAQVMKEGRVQAVIVGADRIAANGDTANKIGTYSLAVVAKAHSVPFYVAAPVNTFDMTLTNGDAIPIEQRSAEEITHGFGRQTAPHGVEVYNPAFDVTPAGLISAIITEKGVISPVNASRVAAVVGR